MRWTRRDVFIDINSFTKKHQNREDLVQEVSHLKILGVKLPVQDSSLFWWFLVQPVLVELIMVEFPYETYQSQHCWIPYITNRNQTI